MNKLSKLLLAALICMIGVIRFGTTSVHAMTQQDLAGKVYRVVATVDGDNGESEDFSSPYYVFINNKGKVVKVDDPDEIDDSDPDNQADIKAARKQIKALTKSQKSAQKVFKKHGHKYTADDTGIKGLIAGDPEITSADVNDIKATRMITSEGAKQLSANGDGLRVNYEMKPVQNIKYHFEWK